MTTMISLAMLTCDRTYHPRADIDQRYVRELTALINQGQGQQLQPLMVADWEGKLTLCDGFHHYWAWQASGADSAPAHVRQEPPRQYCLQLFGVAQHRSPADITRAVRMALQWFAVTPRDVATLLQVPVETVRAEQLRLRPPQLQRLKGKPQRGQAVVTDGGVRGVIGSPWQSREFAGMARVVTDTGAIAVPVDKLYLEAEK